MPMFEYRCQDCDKEFEAFVTAQRTTECPACRSSSLVKLLSSPGMVGVSSGSAKSAMPMGGGCGAGGAHCACRAGQN
jgi:putative FmdB family regulatory protein